jgi:hypothetical protein
LRTKFLVFERLKSGDLVTIADDVGAYLEVYDTRIGSSNTWSSVTRLMKYELAVVLHFYGQTSEIQILCPNGAVGWTHAVNVVGFITGSLT